MKTFIGRKKELQELNNLHQARAASLVVVKGRRRIGKSSLLREFGRSFPKVYTFSGLPPEKNITYQSQREEFARQLARQVTLSSVKNEDWGDLFWQLSQFTLRGHILIILDEISWMGSMDPTFLGKLKNAWDLYFSRNNQLILAVSGSASSWIEKNILSSTGFLGRVTLNMTLEELPLFDCMRFWEPKGHGVSPYDKLKVLSVTGGVPRYLEAIQPQLTAEENIKRLCFQPSGILYNEFDEIFSDLFSKRSSSYKRIVEILVNGAAEQGDICERIGLKRGGDIAEYLNDLVQAGFIARDFTWHIKNNRPSKLSQYRLSDNYSRFYLKYILPNKNPARSDSILSSSLANLPGWSSIMGLQIENLILNNKNLIKDALNLFPSEVVCDNPFFQRKNSKQKGCQVDYLIQTKLNALYVCEIKFSRHEISTSIIEEMRKKIAQIKIPKNFSYWPVLIHVNGVHDQVEDSGYFAKIINFADLIQESCEIKTKGG